MPLLTFGQSETSSKDTISITDTTADGREYTNDIVDDPKLGIMFRTTAVGMDIIREIHASRIRTESINDSLEAINSELIFDLFNCERQQELMTLNIIDLELKNNEVRKQYTAEQKITDNKDLEIKGLKKKLLPAKVIVIGGPIVIGASLAAMFYLLLK